ncbi:ferritin-like domain-containing protein [Adhaeribacter terreus]|uniref:Ferritin-like domain-containing protein n=1 Tax=Adhaeribacter terreus TaxID=529703 RepID=A0ABW0EFB6_9BACT
MAELKDLTDLLHHEIQVLYDAENLLITAIPRIAEKATDPELKAAFMQHLEETKMHKQRLEQAAKLLGIKPDGQDNAGMKGLIAEGEKVMHISHSSEAMDATLIASAQKIEHYEISGYGTAAHLALGLALDEVHTLLKKTLDEEQATDTKLNNLAKTNINRRAAQVS